MPTKSRQARKLKRHFRANRIAYQLFGIILVCALIISLVFIGLSAPGGEPPRPPRTDNAPDEAVVNRTPPIDRDHRVHRPEHALSLEDILERISVAYGGQAAVRKLTAVRQSGRIVPAGGEGASLTFFWRAPDLIRYTLNTPHFDHQRGFNGHQGWEAAFRQQELIHVRELAGTDQRRSIRDFRMSQPVVFSLGQVDRLTLLPPAQVDGQDCYVIALRRDSYEERFFIDQINFLCLRRERSDADLQLEHEHTSVSYKDFREIDGLVFPFHQEVFFDGIPHNEVFVDHLTPNPGLLTHFFNPPVP